MRFSFTTLSFTLLFCNQCLAWEGPYKGRWEYGHVTAIIEKANEFSDQKRYFVDLRVSANGCLGEVRGIGFVSNNVMSFRSDSLGSGVCLISLSKSDKNLSIKTLENCSGYSGPSCGYGGTVSKK